MSLIPEPITPAPLPQPMTDAPVLYTMMESPVAPLLLMTDGQALTGLHMLGGRSVPDTGLAWRRDDGWFRGVKMELDAYFAGELTVFATPLATEGTLFQRRVWAVLREISYGETWSYGTLAARVGNPKASRAVGLANGKNPISILIPCHRVIGADGSLTGYGGGIERKAWLLQHERVTALHQRGFRLTSNPTR